MSQVVPVQQPSAAVVKPVVTKINGLPQAAKPEAAAAPPKPDAPVVDHAAELAKVKAGLDELQKQSKRHALDRQQLAKEKGAWSTEKGALLKEVEELRKLKPLLEQFDVNPDAFLESKMGKDYYDKLTNRRLSGGAPAAEVVASELQKLDAKWQARFNEEFQKRDAAAKTAQQTAAQQRAEGTRKLLKSDAAEFIKANGKDYGALAALGDEASLASMLAQRIEIEYNKTERKDPATGEVVFGRVLSTKEAAELIEQEVLALVEKVTATEKWKQRGAAKTASTTTGEPPQQRRTLNNSTTGRTPGREPPLNDEERRARAIKAFNDRAARNANPNE